MVADFISYIKLWWKAKRANRNLLKSVQSHRNDPPYDPPTRKDVLDFIHNGTVFGCSMGKLEFRHNLSPVAKSPAYQFPKD